ncbi:MAG: RNB domain-containing ribonuclease [Spirochaetaceae bacterium]|nr:RNB domain-containing ribonuclease [Spirochaetaceae bacterium]
MKLTKDSLVLYKQTPAVVISSGDKIDIELPGGKTRSVREKDIFPLHPGPVSSLADLEDAAPEGQPEEAWELLQGETPTLYELAELVYGAHTPSTSWMAFKLLNRSPWFKGTPDSIEVVDEEAVNQRIKADREKAEAESRWEDFIDRFQHGDIHRDKDELFLRDLEMYALGRSKGSRILKAVGKTQSPENAHRVMLAQGVVDEGWNPHPLRLEVPLDIPDYDLGPMPDDDRLDLTAVEAFAIDDEGNQDPDDAIAWDGKRLWVHVADAAALITAGSPGDEAARERASSLYLPEKIVPMLPPEAAHRLGLGLEDTSPALSYAFKFDEQGVISGFTIHLTTVKVTRLSYAQADARMDEEPFATIRKFTDAFRARRVAAGAVSISMPEVKIRVDEQGDISITRLPEMASRNMVTESMLMAGSCAAAWCRQRNIPIPFAVQETTGEAGGDAGDSESDDYAAQFSKRRGMKRSRTTLECSPHSGLGLEAYSRVTSPLRRYPDLIASRQIRQTILDRPPEDADSVLEGLAAFESRSGSLVQAERRSNLFWKVQWLKKRPGWTTEGVLVDRRERQGFFLIPEIALETRVAMKKNVELGGRARLKLKDADVAESTVLFIIEEVLD